MKLKCYHGYFIFKESRIGEVTDYTKLTGLSILPKDDYFTFEKLLSVDDYSLKGKPIVDMPAIKTFSGKPWEVMEANGFVFDFSLGVVVPIDSITTETTLSQTNNAFLSPGLILPGSLLRSGQRVKGYSAFFSFNTLTWRYSEVDYV